MVILGILMERGIWIKFGGRGVVDRMKLIQKPLRVFSPLRGSLKAVQIVLEDD